MADLTSAEVNDEVLEALGPPGRTYLAAITVLGVGILYALVCWIYQIKRGMVVTGLNHPVGWAVYITNFVFWVGIAHSGTLISAILYLARSRWRTSVARSAEAMTVFAVMTAGIFPLIHLGRVWVFYYIVPYPSERQLWPNFISPLVWDICAIGTYFTVSSIFWYVGMVPDLAAARDRFTKRHGPGHFRSKLYRILSLGWSFRGRQWQHYGRAYLFFAALATPLVISVHSVVSWDFAMSLLPGWHSTIFAPYFVAGAIHSGLAMVLTLLIPMRRLLRLQRVITTDHFEAVAQTMIVTSLIVGYAYVVEPFIAWYSGDKFEQAFTAWRAAGWMAMFFWALPVLNVLAPLSFLFKRVRRNLAALFAISILVNIGMWLERFVIIVSSTSHDFLPHNWLSYSPRWVELSVMAGSFAFFLFWFFGFSRLAPTVSISDLKEDLDPGTDKYVELDVTAQPGQVVADEERGVCAIFTRPEPMVRAIERLRAAGLHRLETYSPVRVREAEALLGRGPSPVRYWTLTGAMCGLVGGFWLAIGSAHVNNLVVGAKPPVSVIPYCIVAFEGMVLLGALGNLAGMLFHARLTSPRLPAGYDDRFSVDRYGLFVAGAPAQLRTAREILSSADAEEVRVIG